MNIAVLGAKVIGSTLGKKWSQAGNAVIFGVRDVHNPEVVAMAREVGAQVGTVAEAIAVSDVVVFAVPGAAVAEIVQSYGKLLEGKLVVDAANRMGNGPLNSLEVLSQGAPTAPYARAFSTLGWENFANPNFDGVPADLFYCSPEGDAQAKLETLIGEIGLHPVRVGDARQVEIIDALARLWFSLAFGQARGRNLAFKMLVR